MIFINMEIKIKECKKHGATEYSINSQNKWICNQCRIENVIKHRQKRRQQAIEYMGGCCQDCGYNKCYGALQFHHLNPSEKDKDFYNKQFKNISWSRMIEELKKCVLLCANCHCERHSDC